MGKLLYTEPKQTSAAEVEAMLDLTHMERYHEGNRLEAKLATGGLPESIWETYSAFANTEGGLILLGVEEWEDHSLHIQGLLDPEEMLAQFLSLCADPKVVSADLIGGGQGRAQVMETAQGAVIAIELPPAPAGQRPVYVGGDRYRGSYCRKGDGDYRLSREMVDRMGGVPPVEERN